MDPERVINFVLHRRYSFPPLAVVAAHGDAQHGTTSTATREARPGLFLMIVKYQREHVIMMITTPASSRVPAYAAPPASASASETRRRRRHRRAEIDPDEVDLRVWIGHRGQTQRCRLRPRPPAVVGPRLEDAPNPRAKNHQKLTRRGELRHRILNEPRARRLYVAVRGPRRAAVL